VIGFNLGMGLALNDKASLSIGYDHSAVDRTRQNGQVIPGSVRIQLGTLLIGASYRLEPLPARSPHRRGVCAVKSAKRHTATRIHLTLMKNGYRIVTTCNQQSLPYRSPRRFHRRHDVNERSTDNKELLTGYRTAAELTYRYTCREIHAGSPSRLPPSRGPADYPMEDG
jgi:hypothetical protein